MKLLFEFLEDEEVSRVSSFLLNDTWDLYDPRFGTFGGKCVTCRDGCVGHFAHLELGHYVFHPYFIKEIKQALNSTCRRCSGDAGPDMRCRNCNAAVKAEYGMNAKQLYQAKGHSGGVLTSEEVREIIGDREEKKYIISRILIPPVGIRPPEDVEWPSDLAREYAAIVEAVKKRKGLPFIANVFNRIAGVGRSEAIMKLLSGKEGIFRSIMLGKRLDRCTRSIIKGDPNVPIDHILVPKIVAEKVKIPEIVSSYNAEIMVKRASAGKVWCPDRMVQVGPEDIAIGMTFDRCLENGDRILFNRQPSLSRSSLVSFRIKVREDDEILAIAFNPAVVGTFNADFDGDEMNIFAGFGVESRAEMQILCDIKENVFSDGSLVVKAIQDTITGVYLMTGCEHLGEHPDGDREVSKKIFYDCMCIAERYDIDPPFTGKRLFSLALPRNMQYKDERVVIRDGILEEGVVDGKVLNGILMRHIHDNMGSHEAVRFLDTVQRVTIRWFSEVGFDVKLRDMVWRDEDLLEYSDMEAFGTDTATIRNWVHKICEERYQDTSVMKMVKSGAKGNVVNVAQMSASLGQQHISGDPLAGGKTAEERGFIGSSYVKGLNPEQFFVHAMAAREGVINTGVSTAITGYLNRRSCKIAADIRERYNGTIGTEGKTVQFRI
jgi:DNA-directed RNA polymerase subunit A'